MTPSLPIATTLLLARHGETGWNSERRWQGHADEPLNDVGRAQAAQLTEELAGRGIDAVYASDLARADETARAVADRLGLAVVSDPGLREVDVGSWSGLVHTEIEGADPEGFARWQAGGKGWRDGESYEEMGERVVAAVLEIAARHPGQTVLIVSHGGSIRACLKQAATAGDEEAGFGTTGNCEVVELTFAEGRLATPSL